MDLVFTKEEDDVKNIEIFQPLGKSDHGLVIFDFICKWRTNTDFRPQRLYFKGNYEELNDFIGNTNWENEFESKNINEKWIHFKSKLDEFINRCIPMSKPKKHKVPWMNNKVARAHKKKYFSWQRYMENKSSIRWRNYVKERNNYSKIERDEKRLYERKLSKEIGKNKRAFFKYVNSKLTVKQEIVALKNENGEMKFDDKDLCDISNRYFHSVFNIPIEGEQLPEMERLSNNNISDINITPEMVKAKLEKLNQFKAAGPDGMHPHLLKETADTIKAPLCLIFRDTLQSEQIPDDWRKANVTPIFKKGDRNDPANYRPVSLTSQVCKIMESIIKEVLFDHLTENNLLSDKQHGFRQGRSCLSNLLSTL